MKKIWLIMFWLLQNLSIANATINVSIEPTNIQEGEPFRLTITQDHETHDRPDVSVLKHDFTLMGTEHNRSYTMINGQASVISQWSFLLTPLKTGHLSIPAIHIGNEASPATFITVMATNPQNKTITNSAVFFTTKISPKTPYINQQILYTVKLYRRLQLLNVDYQPPQLDNALIIPLGEGQHSEQNLQGTLYAVEEQQYAIFPQQKGRLSIVGPALQALIYDLTPKPFHLNATITPINVRSRPKEAADYWLPAKHVLIREEYDQIPQIINIGDTISRTITLRTWELPAQSIPPLNLEKNSTFNSYTEKPTLNNRIKNHNLIGEMRVKITYLFKEAGTISLPEIQVPWFNTATQQFATATLSKKIIQVQGKSIAIQPNNFQNTNIIQQNAQSNTTHIDKFNKYKPKLYLFLLALGIFCLILVATRKIFSAYKHKLQTRLTLKHACLQNNPFATKEALFNFAKQQWPNTNFQNIMQLSAFINNTALTQALEHLSSALYNQSSSTSWSGIELWNCIRKLKLKKIHKKAKKQQLPPLHPK